MIRLLTEKDKDEVLEYTERNHIETTFIIGNVISFGLDNNPNINRCAHYYGYFEKESLKGILPFYNLGSCIPHYESEAAIDEFSELMKSRSFNYLLGMQKIVEPLYNKLKNTKNPASISHNSYFINENFSPFKLEGVELVNAWELSLKEVEDFLNETVSSNFNALGAVENFPKLLSELGPDEDYIFLLKDGEVKAQALIQTYTSKINQIGGVYTRISERGKGYCKALISELCTRIASRYKLPTLTVRKNNTPAVRAYTSLGFKHYDDYLIINYQ